MLSKGETVMSLEQKYLNVRTRGEGYMDILMYVPDTSAKIKDISSNDILSYSNLNSITNIKNYTNTTIATLEENMWLLNGNFINPTPGRTYNGYISNSVSDENCEFSTNPTISIDLSSSAKVEYFSVILNPAVKNGYPRQVKLTVNNGSTHEFIKNISSETSLPNLIYEVNLDNVNSVTIEFIGTLTSKRRIRVASVMFGKVITLDQNEVLNSDYTDKCSYVPDSIPSRVFSFSLENYSQKYNIDNPDNSYLSLTTDTRVIMRNGYNIFGYTEKDDGTAYMDNPDRVQAVEWDDWKEFRLLSTTTGTDDTCTFECGSILDMMTDTYTRERFINNRTVSYIVANLLDFMGLSTDIVIFSSDSNGKSYGDYEINTVLPELPVRELIQLLAFSVGATLLIKDDGTIKFANLELDNPSSFTHQHEFTYTDFTSIPAAEQLENTTKISLPKYNSTIGTEEEKLQTVTVSQYNTEVTYSACVPTGASPDDKVQSADLYACRGTLVVAVSDAEPTVEVEIYGYKIDTTTTQERTVTNDTLIIDTQLMKDDPNDIIKNKYKLWYSKKFKYTMDTRGEILVDAGDYIEFQTPFSGTETLVKGYVLSNHVTFDGSWSGDMEVVVL
jgi:hypothetical protein